MGAILLAVVVIVLCALICAAFGWSVENDIPLIGIPAAVLAVILAFVGLFSTINAGAYIYTINTLDAQHAYKQEQRLMYMDALTAYQDLRIQDVTGSETYLSLYKEILSFNKECDKADRYQNTWWAEGLLYDPSYLCIDPVPLRVME